MGFKTMMKIKKEEFVNQLSGSGVEVSIDLVDKVGVFHGVVMGLMDWGATVQFLFIKIKNERGKEYDQFINLEKIVAIMVLKAHQTKRPKEPDSGVYFA
jgi:ribosomal protein L19